MLLNFNKYILFNTVCLIKTSRYYIQVNTDIGLDTHSHIKTRAHTHTHRPCDVNAALLEFQREE